MVSRRNKPFRKTAPSRRPGQIRRAPGRWETVLEEEHDLDGFDDGDDGWDEQDAPADRVTERTVALPHVPAPRTAEHDALEVAPVPETAVEEADVEEPGLRRSGRRVLAYGAVGLVLATAIGIVLLLTSRSGPDLRNDPPVAFGSPVPLPVGGEYVRTRVLASGDLQVDHWIRSKQRLSRLDLSLPTVPGAGAGQLTARRLDVLADGRDLGVPRTLELGQGYSLGGSRELHVSYVLRGATERSGPGERALARVTSLDLAYSPRPSQRTQTVVGAKVLALACYAPDATPAPCGEPSLGQWSVQLSGARVADQVMAQIDLSSAGS